MSRRSCTRENEITASANLDPAVYLAIHAIGGIARNRAAIYAPVTSIYYINIRRKLAREKCDFTLIKIYSPVRKGGLFLAEKNIRTKGLCSRRAGGGALAALELTFRHI